MNSPLRLVCTAAVHWIVDHRAPVNVLTFTQPHRPHVPHIRYNECQWILRWQTAILMYANGITCLGKRRGRVECRWNVNH